MRPKGTGILYILKDSIQLFTSSPFKLSVYPFKKESVDDLTIINKDLFEADIMHFVADNEINANNLVLVIADKASVIKAFEKDGVHEHASSEGIITKTIPTQHGTFLYSVSEQLCISIKTAFEKLGFSVDFVLPALAFGKEFNNKANLSLKDIETVLKQAFTLEEYNLIPTKMMPNEQELDLITKRQTDRDIMRLYAAATIFGALVIAIIVAWNTNNPNPTQTYRGRAEKNQVEIVMPKVQETKGVTVRILSGPTSSKSARELKESLIKYHFQNLSVQIQNQTRRKGLIIFTGKPSPTVRGAILAEVEKYMKNTTVIDQLGSTFDITIILP
jgi:hypothetical protein